MHLDTEIGSTGIGLLCLALVLALGFEFVNGFHDTANAVATVIYTKSLRPMVAVVWSGCCNFLGVAIGGVAVAMSIVKLLPPDALTGGGARDGAGPAFGGDRLESRHLVLRAARFELAHPHRRDPRRVAGECVDRAQVRPPRGPLASPRRGRSLSSHLADHRIRRDLRARVARASVHQEPRAALRACAREAPAAALDPRAPHDDVRWRLVRPWVERRSERGSAS